MSNIVTLEANERPVENRWRSFLMRIQMSHYNITFWMKEKPRTIYHETINLVCYYFLGFRPLGPCIQTDEIPRCDDFSASLS